MRLRILLVTLTVAACASSPGSKDHGSSSGGASGSAGGGVGTGGAANGGAGGNGNGSPGTGGVPSTGGRGGVAGGAGTGANAGTGGGAGASAAGGSAGASAGAGGQGALAVPGLGECVVIRRFETRASSIVNAATRLSDGFASVSSMTPSHVVWLLGDEAGQWRELDITTPFLPYLSPLSVGTVRDPLLMLFARSTDTGSEKKLLAQTVRADGTAVAAAAPVLSVFDSATAIYPLGVALDGERVAVGNGQNGTRDPHFVLIDKNGQPVGGEVRLLDTGNQPVLDCFVLTGTAHGIVGSVADMTTRIVHVVELNAAGEIVNQATSPFPEGSANCPQVSAGETVYFAFPSRDGSISLRHLASNTLSEVAMLPPPSSGVGYAWVSGGIEPLVAFGRSYISFGRLNAGAFFPLTSKELFSGVLLSSADGRAFVSDARIDISVTPPATTLKVIEVSCGGSGVGGSLRHQGLP